MWNANFRVDPDSEEESQHEDSEMIMKEIQKLYTSKDVGLRDAAKFLSDYGLEFRVTVPRQKTTVLVVGEHYLAKQKFLDKYFDEPRQGPGSFITKVNYEKLDKIFITQGNRKRWLTGETVLDYCPNLAKLKNIPGLNDYLTTEISSKKTKSLVSFVLAPESSPADLEDDGEVDADVNNNHLHPNKPLSIGKAIKTLGEAADLIFIFFDPTGLHPPGVTLKPYAKLWENHHEKIHLILAKADPDECTEEEREETITGIVRETWRIPEVQKVGYLPLIYCPDLTIPNKDEERLQTIIQTQTDKSISRALNQLEKDASKIQELLRAKLDENTRAKSYASAPISCSLWLSVLGAILTSMAVTEFSDAIFQNPALEWKSFCRPAISSKFFLAGALMVALWCTVRFLLMESHSAPLTNVEEELLNRRIQFTEYAIGQKKEIEKMYIANSSSDFKRNYRH